MVCIVCYTKDIFISKWLLRHAMDWDIYRPHPKDGEGNVFSLSTPGGGSGQRSIQPGGGVRSSQWGGGGRSKVNSAGGGSGPASGGGSGQRSIQPGGVRSSWGGGQVQLVGGVRSSPGGGSSPAGWGGVRSSRGGVRSSQGGGSASCTLLRAVCLLRSRRRTFLFRNQNTQTNLHKKEIGAWQSGQSTTRYLYVDHHRHEAL